MSGIHNFQFFFLDFVCIAFLYATISYLYITLFRKISLFKLIFSLMSLSCGVVIGILSRQLDPIIIGHEIANQKQQSIIIHAIFATAISLMPAIPILFLLIVYRIVLKITNISKQINNIILFVSINLFLHSIIFGSALMLTIITFIQASNVLIRYEKITLVNSIGTGGYLSKPLYINNIETNCDAAEVLWIGERSIVAKCRSGIIAIIDHPQDKLLIQKNTSLKYAIRKEIYIPKYEDLEGASPIFDFIILNIFRKQDGTNDTGARKA